MSMGKGGDVSWRPRIRLQVLLMGVQVIQDMTNVATLHMKFAQDKVNCMLGTVRDLPFQWAYDVACSSGTEMSTRFASFGSQGRG